MLEASGYFGMEPGAKYPWSCGIAPKIAKSVPNFEGSSGHQTQMASDFTVSSKL